MEMQRYEINRKRIRPYLKMHILVSALLILLVGSVLFLFFGANMNSPQIGLVIGLMLGLALCAWVYWHSKEEDKLNQALIDQIEDEIGEVIEDWTKSGTVLVNNKLTRYIATNHDIFVGDEVSDRVIQKFYKERTLKRLLSDRSDWVDKEKYNVSTIDDYSYVKKGLLILLSNGSTVLLHDKKKMIIKDNL